MTRDAKEKIAAKEAGPVLNPQSESSFLYTHDSTAVQEFSFTNNFQYSKEIIQDSEKVYDLTKLQLLKKEDKNKFLKEGKKQVDKLWKNWQSMEAHTQMFVVTFQIRIGTLLAEIETVFRDKSKYAAWIRNNFGDERMRYFQQARELAEIGDLAVKYRALGKNRLLEIKRLVKSTKKSFEDILKEHPFPDLTQDMEGKIQKEHVDAIISYHRFKGGGIDFIDFDQATLMAAYHHGDIEVKIVEKIKRRIEQEQNKQEFFEDYVMDKMKFPEERSARKVSWESLNMLLSSIVEYRKKVNIEDEEWIKRQRELLSELLFAEAFGFLSDLKDKWRINISLPQTSKPKKGN